MAAGKKLGQFEGDKRVFERLDLKDVEMGMTCKLGSALFFVAVKAMAGDCGCDPAEKETDAQTDVP